MTYYPAPREIPPGKILIAEWRDVGIHLRAIGRTIAEAPSARVRAVVRIVWSSPGYESAGSCARWTNGFWAVRWRDSSGAIQGRRYLPTEAGEAEARAHFAKLADLASSTQKRAENFL